MSRLDTEKAAAETPNSNAFERTKILQCMKHYCCIYKDSHFLLILFKIITKVIYKLVEKLNRLLLLRHYNHRILLL